MKNLIKNITVEMTDGSVLSITGKIYDSNVSVDFEEIISSYSGKSILGEELSVRVIADKITRK